MGHDTRLSSKLIINHIGNLIFEYPQDTRYPQRARLAWIIYKGMCHNDVIKWKHFPRYWLFVRGIRRASVNFPHKGQWRGALMFSIICAWINSWVHNREAADLRRHRAHYDVIVIHGLSVCGMWPHPGNIKCQFLISAAFITARPIKYHQKSIDQTVTAQLNQTDKHAIQVWDNCPLVVE